MNAENEVFKGSASRFVFREIDRRCGEREQKIINKLVSKYRSSQTALEPDEIYAGIASIAELRSLVQDVENDIRKGIENLKKPTEVVSNG